MKEETWDLREAVEEACFKIYEDKCTPDLRDEISNHLCAKIQSHIDWLISTLSTYKCPHVRGNPEGSQWCELSETSLNKLQADFYAMEASLEELESGRRLPRWKMEEK